MIVKSAVLLSLGATLMTAPVRKTGLYPNTTIDENAQRWIDVHTARTRGRCYVADATIDALPLGGDQ